MAHPAQRIKPHLSARIEARVTPEERELFRVLGGSYWLREQLAKQRKKEKKT